MSLLQSYRNSVSTHLHLHREKRIFFIGVFILLFLLYPKVSSASGSEDPYVLYVPGSGAVTSGNVIATLENMSEQGILLSPDNNEYLFTGNGENTFKYKNGSGVEESYLAQVDWIDKQPATGIVEYSTQETTTGSLSVIAIATGFDEDVVFINPAGTGVYLFTEDGDFTFHVKDAAGNETELEAQVDWIEEEVQDTSCDINDVVITSPANGSGLGGTFPIQRELSDLDNCAGIQVAIMLWDHNEQWIAIGTSDLAQEEYLFDSMILAETGAYTITGTYLSGDTYEILDSTGTLIETGIYEQDADYTIYTGLYTGFYTGYATGYKITLANMDCDDSLVQLSCLLNQSDCPEECHWANDALFTIDNIAPELDEQSIEIQGTVYSGTVGFSGTILREFEANELLHEDLSYIINGSQVAGLETVTETTYTISVPLLYVEHPGAISYEILFTDIAGNTGSVEGISDIVFDNTTAQLSGVSLTGTFLSGMTLRWNTDQETIYTLTILDEDQEAIQTGATTGHEHQHMSSIQALNEEKSYTIIIQGNNRRGNKFNREGELSSTDGKRELVIEDEEVTVKEPEHQSMRDSLKQQLQRFQVCKNELTMSAISFPIKGESYDFQIPNFKRSELRLVIQAFTSVLVRNIKNSDLSKEQIEEMVMRLNNMFVVIKLVRDDNNSCEQNLSNYYIGQFMKIVEDTKIFE